MAQRGQVFELKSAGEGGQPLWAYRYRPGGREAKRVQRGGVWSDGEARRALTAALEMHDRRSAQTTLAQLVDAYLAQHEVAPRTLRKLRWLLGKATAAFGDRRIDTLRAEEIAAWRMSIPEGHRFETTQALRQVLARAVIWGLVDHNPALEGVTNPTRKGPERRPFDTWRQVRALADELAARQSEDSSIRRRSAWAMTSGVGGQPGMRRSSGRTASTEPTTSSVVPRTLQPSAQSPRAATRRGSGIAS